MAPKSILVLVGITLFIFPCFINADTLGQRVKFNINPSYDLEKREQIFATLQKITDQIYFYIDDEWWNSLDSEKRKEIFESLNNLTQEFEQKIYPTLTSYFGSEWKPGIDKDLRITILIHPMIEDAGGYVNSGDEYPKAQNPKSNQREMIYLNASIINQPLAKTFLAHEFTHLITFNQKDKIYGISEEIWLNEARAEYAPTLLGYDQDYQGTNLQNRVKIFIDKPFDSLTEWRNKKEDYGVINLFIQYLVDHYGIEILVDSLRSPKIGIPSINYALEKRGFSEDFSLIFTQWTIAVLVNDCNLGPKYCYLNPNLRNLRITPQINFLPLGGESSLEVTNAIKNWSSTWQKIIGGKGNLILEFDGADEVKFVVPYLICDYQENCSVDFLNLDQNQRGTVTIPEFNIKYTSLTIIPSIQSKFSGFDDLEPNYLFSWKASIVEKTPEQKQAELREKLLAEIEFLKKEIARLQAEIAKILVRQRVISCQRLDTNLHYGMMGNAKVRCLQEFLRAQGPEIYPEGLVTGNFLFLTKAAVIRFQEKYASEILAPWGLTKGTGFVGPSTRAKINELIRLRLEK